MKKILFAALLATMMPFGFSYAQTDYKMQGPYEVVAPIAYSHIWYRQVTM